mgnify:CR=1 FL=1
MKKATRYQLELLFLRYHHNTTRPYINIIPYGRPKARPGTGAPNTNTRNSNKARFQARIAHHHIEQANSTLCGVFHVSIEVYRSHLQTFTENIIFL